MKYWIKFLIIILAIIAVGVVTFFIAINKQNTTNNYTSTSFQDYCIQKSSDQNNCISRLKNLCTITGGKVDTFCGSSCNEQGICTDVCNPYYDYCVCENNEWNFTSGCNKN